MKKLKELDLLLEQGSKIEDTLFAIQGNIVKKCKKLLDKDCQDLDISCDADFDDGFTLSFESEDMYMCERIYRVPVDILIQEYKSSSNKINLRKLKFIAV